MNNTPSLLERLFGARRSQSPPPPSSPLTELRLTLSARIEALTKDIKIARQNAVNLAKAGSRDAAKLYLKRAAVLDAQITRLTEKLITIDEAMQLEDDARINVLMATVLQNLAAAMKNMALSEADIEALMDKLQKEHQRVQNLSAEMNRNFSDSRDPLAPPTPMDDIEGLALEQELDALLGAESASAPAIPVRHSNSTAVGLSPAIHQRLKARLTPASKPTAVLPAE